MRLTETLAVRPRCKKLPSSATTVVRKGISRLTASKRKLTKTSWQRFKHKCSSEVTKGYYVSTASSMVTTPTCALWRDKRFQLLSKTTLNSTAPTQTRLYLQRILITFLQCKIHSSEKEIGQKPDSLTRLNKLLKKRTLTRRRPDWLEHRRSSWRISRTIRSRIMILRKQWLR